MKSSANGIKTKTIGLSITFLAAQSIPLPTDTKSVKGFNPYVKVELHVDGSTHHREGHVLDEANSGEAQYKIKTKTRKGCNVDFMAEKVEFPLVRGVVDELCFVRFTVRDDEIGRDSLAAWACVRLDRLGNGYRFVHLTDTRGKLTDGVILIKVEKSIMT